MASGCEGKVGELGALLGGRWSFGVELKLIGAPNVRVFIVYVKSDTPRSLGGSFGALGGASDW